MLLVPKAAFRFAVGATRTSTRFSASLPYRLATPNNAALLSRGSLIVSSQRAYATPGRPKKGSIEESSRKSRPRKAKVTKDESTGSDASEKKSFKPKVKAVKAPKEESADAKVAREAKEAAKKAKADQKKLRETARKEKLKQRELKEKERKAKLKQREKQRADLKKKREQGRAKKPLTDDQKTKLKKKQDAAALKEVKATALNPPKRRRLSAIAVFTGERVKEKAANNPDKRPVRELLSETSGEFKQLSASELEHYNHLANETRRVEEEQYRAYVKQFTPDQIRVANVARSKLRVKQGARKWKAIEDDRLVTRPVGPYAFFNTARFKSGDFKHIHIVEASKLISQEWRDLASSDKQQYIDLSERQREQYLKDYRETYGHESPTFHGSKEATPTE